MVALPDVRGGDEHDDPSNPQEFTEEFTEEDEEGLRFNLRLPTLGGKQFWTDHCWKDGWRLQENALTGHWRVLNPSNVRYGWGTREECQAILDEHLPSPLRAERHVVVLLHGLMRSGSSMQKMAQAVEEAGLGRAILFEYASTRRGIAEHAAAFREFLESIPGQPRIDLIAHSMGNIVVRHALADYQQQGDPRGLLERLGGLAMLGPPNQGADIAKQLGRLGLFETVTGRGGMELGPAWAALEERLAIPPCPFMIVAGDLSESWMFNPMVSGPSDLVVRVEETYLPGARDHHSVHVLHSFLMNDPEVQRLVINFLVQLPGPHSIDARTSPPVEPQSNGGTQEEQQPR